jgi:hypothetical protein
MSSYDREPQQYSYIFKDSRLMKHERETTPDRSPSPQLIGVTESPAVKRRKSLQAELQRVISKWKDDEAMPRNQVSKLRSYFCAVHI